MLCLDPGHGPVGSGCSGNGVDEATYVLDMAQLVQAELRRRGVEACLTRETMEHMSFTERAAVARRNRAKGVVVLHVNSDAARGSHGPMAFHLGVNAVAMEAARVFITKLNRHGEYVDTQQRLRPMQHQVWTAAVGGWREHAWNCMFRHDEPVCLLEMFYASNAEDAAWGQSGSGVGALVEAIADTAQTMLG